MHSDLLLVIFSNLDFYTQRVAELAQEYLGMLWQHWKFLLRPTRRRRIELTDEAAQELEDLLVQPRAFSPTPPRPLPTGHWLEHGN